MTRVALYLRVSTSDQTTDNQRRDLQAVAARLGWHVVRVFEDAGISGAKSRQDRPGLDELLRGVTRRDFELVAAWSVDRLGRSLPDLLTLLGELHAKGVGLYLHQQGLDTTTPAGKAMFSMLGVFGEFERSMIQERVKAGLARVRAEGKTLGRPRVSKETEKAIQDALRQGASRRKIAAQFGVGMSVLQRIADSFHGTSEAEESKPAGQVHHFVPRAA